MTSLRANSDDDQEANVARETLVEADRPYDIAGIAALHPDGWFEIPVRYVAVARLKPTQADVSLARIAHHASGGEAEADSIPHVVVHDGSYYLHDGHHRYAVALARGDAVISARVVDESGRPR